MGVGLLNDSGALQILVPGAAVAACAAVTGFGLARLRRWAVWSGVIIAVPLVLIFPLGTIIAGEALFTLIRHRALASEDHRELVRLTPEQTPAEFSRWQLYVIAALLIFIVAFLALRISGS